MVDAIVFDIGNVLLRFDFNIAIKRITPRCSASPERIVELLEPLKVELECGRLQGDGFLSKTAENIGFSGDLRELRAAWQEIFEPIEANHQLVARLRGKVPLYLLSNTNDLHAEYFLEKYAVFESFDGAVFSHQAGMMKPDVAIYEHAVHQFALDPKTTLFIDDLLPNVQAAASLGWQIHHYEERKHEDLLIQCAGLGLK
jgi:glucose-1-phosphatase